MSSKNQTAVEWLIELLHPTISVRLSNTYIKVLKEKAKAMEKQQIADAFDYEADEDMHDYSSGEQYYDQTFL